MQALLLQDLHSHPGTEEESNLDFYPKKNNTITSTAGEDEADGDSTARETNIKTTNSANNHPTADQSRITCDRRSQVRAPRLPATPIHLVSTLYNTQQPEPRNIRSINTPRTTVVVRNLPISEPSIPAEDQNIEEGRRGNGLYISQLSRPAELHSIDEGGIGGSLQAIAMEHNPGYNCPLDHMTPTPPSSANFGSTSAPTPECEAFITVWPTSKQQRVGSISDTHNSSCGDGPNFKNYEPYNPSTADEQGTEETKPERNSPATRTEMSIDILTEHNPGYNLPLEHMAPTSPSSHADSSAPTPESEAFMSVWTHNRQQGEEGTAETQESSLTKETVKLALTETSV